MQVLLTDAPSEAMLAVIRDGLAAFNDADVGPSLRRPLCIAVEPEPGRVAGGLSGYTAWGWLYVQWLWFAPELRGQGLAGRVLGMAEAEALARGCHGALIDTFSPVGRKVYERAGYTVFGQLPDFPIGRTRFFLQKTLS